MIITEAIEKQRKDFEKLLGKTRSAMEKKALREPHLFIEQTAIPFEEDVKDALIEEADGTDFKNRIHLISGHSFPDIEVADYFGVEVKTTKQGGWKSTGNSVLESTRLKNIEKIYLYFAQLTKPPKFMFKPYEECLYDIAVTHSPRYLIDMELREKGGKSIFDKINKSYDELRTMPNPIQPIVAYYRKCAKPGEEPWWMDTGDTSEIVLRPTVKLWCNLALEEQITLRNEAMARFPEIFGKSSTKYQRLASWLAARHGIVDPSLRDRFTAGGKVTLQIGKRKYENLPRVFLHLLEQAEEVIKIVKKIPPDEAKYHWNLAYEPNSKQKINEWTNRIIRYSSEILRDSRSFIIHLLGDKLEKKDCPPEIKEEMGKYGLD